MNLGHAEVLNTKDGYLRKERGDLESEGWWWWKQRRRRWRRKKNKIWKKS